MSNGTIISREKFSGPDRVANLYTVPQDTHRITYSDSSWNIRHQKVWISVKVSVRGW